MNPSEPTDEELARRLATARLKSQRTECFEDLYQRHGRLLMAFVAARLPSSDWEDLLQTIWLRVWRHASQFRDGSFRAWLYTIARNAIIDHHRIRKPPISMSDSEPQVDEDPLDRLLDVERQQAVERCLGGLRHPEAEVLRQLLEGRSYEDVCSTLQINVNVAYKAAGSAKSKLRACVQSELS